jgi:CheY-like chemotaxis protein
MPSSPIKILVIEDEHNTRTYLVNLLQAHGFYPIPASRAEEALILIQTEHPGMVILDAMLPYDEAYHIYYQLKTDSELKKIPVMLVSSLGRRAMGRFYLWPLGSSRRRLPEPEAILGNPPEAEEFLAMIAQLIGLAPETTCEQNGRDLP